MRGPFRLGYGALLGLFLTACSFAVTVDLPERSFSVAALPNTQGKILYPIKDPATDPGCTDLSSYGIQAYACGIGPDDERAGEARFQWSPSAPLTLQGENLTQGIAQGGFWLGLEVQGLPSGPVNFTLKNPKALVTVGL
ncbi:hypothetical protein [Thermus neutrinimicus]|uniref:hypothetical protein n=1 Tax=Thermus neutrinimicus TaxID=2908149 RepID=UPI001FA9FF30|nr:hypothetical protein [Thermus neutrinimicus]